jgi:hypothetical protein
MANNLIFSTLPVAGATSLGGNSAYFNYIPLLNSSGLFDSSFGTGSGGAFVPPYTPGNNPTTLFNNHNSNAIITNDINGNPLLYGYSGGGTSINANIGFDSSGNPQITTAGSLSNLKLGGIVDSTASTGTSGQVFTANGTGGAKWQTPTSNSISAFVLPTPVTAL